MNHRYTANISNLNFITQIKFIGLIFISCAKLRYLRETSDTPNSCIQENLDKIDAEREAGIGKAGYEFIGYYYTVGFEESTKSIPYIQIHFITPGK